MTPERCSLVTALSLTLLNAKQVYTIRCREVTENNSTLVEFTSDFSVRSFLGYRGTSLVRNRRPLGPYSSPMPGALWWS